ncbi:hypothetical protein B0H14DRAFT_3133792 [Mycena olivaceomarginata]|nr:hypothetical protein B0H14DRAFT_3133792 [Mycena olivaceomarginata]
MMEPHLAGLQLPSIRTLHPYLPALGPGPSTSTSTYEPAQMSTQSQGAGAYPPSSHAGSDGDERGVTGENEPPKKKRRRQALSCTECKRRKIRCDRTQPCALCVRRGDQAKCQWHVIEPAAGKYVSRAEHDALCTRVDALELRIQQLFAAQSLPPGVGQRSVFNGPGQGQAFNPPYNNTPQAQNPTPGQGLRPMQMPLLAGSQRHGQGQLSFSGHRSGSSAEDQFSKVTWRGSM